MVWFKCVGPVEGGGSSGTITPVLMHAKISTTENGGAYVYPTYSDISEYDCVLIKAYVTVNDVYYENYGSLDCDILPRITEDFRTLYNKNDTSNNWNQNLQFNVTNTAITSINYTGNWADIYIDIYGIKLT